jgi:hypothetical protein
MLGVALAGCGGGNGRRIRTLQTRILPARATRNYSLNIYLPPASLDPCQCR